MTQYNTNQSTNASSPQTKKKRVLIMAAGTGGHVFPALAVARELQSRGCEVQWLGTTHGMENRLLANEQILLHQIAIKGMRGNGLMRLLKTPFSVLAATLKTIQIIRANKIDAVAGFGGYVAAPGGLAARLLGVPLIIHEQNAIAGMTNRYLARIASVVLEAFPNTFRTAQHTSSSSKIKTVGNPVRADIAAVAEARIAQQKKQAEQSVDANVSAQAPRPLSVLVIGGSLGAQILNETVPKAAALIDEPLTITHQCGRGHLEATKASYQHALQDSKQHQADVKEFIADMAKAYTDHDVLICRAGASTVSEVAATGIPAIFIPLPHAVDDHQTANARYLSDAEAAVLLPQTELTPRLLASKLQALTQNGVCQAMGVRARNKAMLNATEKAVDIIIMSFAQ